MTARGIDFSLMCLLSLLEYSIRIPFHISLKYFHNYIFTLMKTFDSD